MILLGVNDNQLNIYVAVLWAPHTLAHTFLSYYHSHKFSQNFPEICKKVNSPITTHSSWLRTRIFFRFQEISKALLPLTQLRSQTIFPTYAQGCVICSTQYSQHWFYYNFSVIVLPNTFFCLMINNSGPLWTIFFPPRYFAETPYKHI